MIPSAPRQACWFATGSQGPCGKETLHQGGQPVSGESRRHSTRRPGIPVRVAAYYRLARGS